MEGGYYGEEHHTITIKSAQVIHQVLHCEWSELTLAIYLASGLGDDDLDHLMSVFDLETEEELKALAEKEKITLSCLNDP